MMALGGSTALRYQHDLPFTGRVTKGKPGMLSRAMPSSVVLPELGSVLTSMTHVAIKDHKDTWVLGYVPPLATFMFEGCASIFIRKMINLHSG